MKTKEEDADDLMCYATSAANLIACWQNGSNAVESAAPKELSEFLITEWMYRGPLAHGEPDTDVEAGAETGVAAADSSITLGVLETEVVEAPKSIFDIDFAGLLVDTPAGKRYYSSSIQGAV